ncbi:MAG TPA: hypothetical protein VN894_11305 [Polyangiaceae bacterium]|nr:hypothetical protein [Polyangiaceae bacterium]
MSVDTFGLGYVFTRRTDIGASPTPDYLGIAQSFDFSMKQKVQKLMGQNRVAVDAAGAELDISGKIKFARLNVNLLNNLLFGQTVTPLSGKQISVVVNGLPEQHTCAATVTVTNPVGHATAIEDLGVFYASGASAGVQFARVASAPAVGQYSVVESTGVYSFNATDVAAGPTLSFFYEYQVATLNSVAVANTLMGTLPAFEVHYQHYYVSINGTLNAFHLKLNACRGEGFDMPFKNTDFQVIDWSFIAFADTAGNIMTMDGTE